MMAELFGLKISAGAIVNAFRRSGGAMMAACKAIKTRLLAARVIASDETTTRMGVAITWLPTPRWSYSASFDHDNIDSDDPVRGQERNRFGVSAGYTF